MQWLVKLGNTTTRFVFSPPRKPKAATAEADLPKVENGAYILIQVIAAGETGNTLLRRCPLRGADAGLGGDDG
jgi:hypothetical protein